MNPAYYLNPSYLRWRWRTSYRLRLSVYVILVGLATVGIAVVLEL